MSEAERAGTSRQDKSARLLAGRYRLGGVLGRGGMGTVWRAEDETLGRTVAVKELRFPSSIDDEEKRRLITRTLREAKAIAKIRNNSAVTVFDVVEEDDRPWIVMELVEGRSLAEVIREDGLLKPRRAAEVGLAILDVLRAAHRAGILHRDVKPSNVLIAEDGRVVLTDFGIAQVEGDPSITSTGMLVGAPSYIAPERARGHKPGPAADLWSLGGLLYAAVEGAPPYDKGSAIATLTAVMTEPLEEPKHAGPLRDVIYGLLTKDPLRRLDDAGARALLEKIVYAPEPETTQPMERTQVVPIAAAPEAPAKPAERTRPVAKAPVTAGAPAAGRTGTAAGGVPAPANTPAAGRSSGWPVMTPPDLPARPVQRAPLTDVVPKRTLVIIAVVVVLAVIGTVLAVTLGDDGADSSRGEGGGRTVASESAGVAPKEDESGGTRTDGEVGRSAQPDGTAPSGGAGTQVSPATGGVVSSYKGGQGYAIGLPAGWAFKAASSAGDRFTGPDGQKLLVAWTGTPQDDPVADWKRQERAMRRAEYRKVRIEAVSYRDWNTADWEFTYTESGTSYRTIDRGFVVDDTQGYALMYTAKAADWAGELRKSTWTTLTESFRPKK